MGPGSSLLRMHTLYGICLYLKKKKCETLKGSKHTARRLNAQEIQFNGNTQTILSCAAWDRSVLGGVGDVLTPLSFT